MTLQLNSVKLFEIHVLIVYNKDLDTPNDKGEYNEYNY